jgi:hypothetical protein
MYEYRSNMLCYGSAVTDNLTSNKNNLIPYLVSERYGRPRARNLGKLRSQASWIRDTHTCTALQNATFKKFNSVSLHDLSSLVIHLNNIISI